MKNTVHLLDCTLRDGGYVNDWRFGDDSAKEIVALTGRSGVEYAELGFVRTDPYESNKMQFSEMSQISRLFCPSDVKLAAMVEIGYGYPVSLFPRRSRQTVDLVRLIVWKRMMAEGLAYAQALLDKGYDVAVQMTRTEQYSIAEFSDAAAGFSALGVKAVYIVDTFGLLTQSRLFEYANAADRVLAPGVRLGYHAHNNMQQAFSNATALCEHPWHRDLMLDASVMGIGRGAGNLCLELIEKYLCENFDGAYRSEFLYACADRHIRKIYEKTPWGYSIPYLLSAVNGRNPSYVARLTEAGLSFSQMDAVFKRMREQDVGIRFDPELCDRMIAEVVGRGA